jgi:hypothetical protein
MRGIPVEAVKKNTPIMGSEAKAADIYSEELQCKWLRDMYTIVADKPGPRNITIRFLTCMPRGALIM